MPNAHSLIVLSALIVGGLYAYRWLAGGRKQPGKLSAAKLAGLGSQVSPEGFLIAWGAVYLGLSILSSGAPQLAGALAVLIALGNALANFSPIAKALGELQQHKLSELPEMSSSLNTALGHPGQLPEFSPNLAGAFGEPAGSGSGEAPPANHFAPAPSQIKVHRIDWAGLKRLITSSGASIDVNRAVAFLRKGGSVAELEAAARRTRRAPRLKTLAPNLETAFNQN